MPRSAARPPTRSRFRLLGVALAVAVAVAVGALLAASWGGLLPGGRPATDEGRPSARSGAPVGEVPRTVSTRIAVTGDTGTGEAAQLATARRIALEARGRPFDALLVLGDLVYDVGDAELADERVLEPFAAVLDGGAELLPVLGNHDYGSDEQDRLLAKLGRRSPWYVVQLDGVRVVVLDSNRVDDEAQTRWLRDVLAEPAPRGAWTVAAMHHPAYSAGAHGSDLAVRAAWADLFAAHDVPLVLAGHDHDYQRSLPQDGVTYVVSGAGAKLRPTGTETFTAVSSSTLHFVDLLVTDRALVGRAIDQSGRLLDEFRITR